MLHEDPRHRPGARSGEATLADRLLPLRVTSQPAGLIRWLLIAQCTIGEAVGVSLTLKDWGAPTEEGVETEAEPYFGANQPSRPGTAQQQPETVAMAMGGGGGPPMGGGAPPQYTGGETPRREGSYAAHNAAHDDAMAGARAARARNEGSLSFGWDGPAPPSSNVTGGRGRGGGPPAARLGAPWEQGGTVGSLIGGTPRVPPPFDVSDDSRPRPSSYAEWRPDTAASAASDVHSMTSMEAARIRAKNQGSNIFG